VREAVERQTCWANKLQPRPQRITLASPRPQRLTLPSPQGSNALTSAGLFDLRRIHSGGSTTGGYMRRGTDLFSNWIQPRPQRFTFASPDAPYPRPNPMSLLASVSEASVVLRPLILGPARFLVVNPRTTGVKPSGGGPYPRSNPIGLLADVSEAGPVLRPSNPNPAVVARNRKNPPSKSAGFPRKSERPAPKTKTDRPTCRRVWNQVGPTAFKCKPQWWI